MESIKSLTCWNCFLFYIAPLMGLVLLALIIWKWKNIIKLLNSRFLIFTPLVNHIKKYPFGSTLIITFVCALLLAVYSFEEREIVTYKGLLFELSKLVMSIILVTILLSANRFVPFVTQALKKFFTSKEFLDKLNSNELEEFVEYINQSTNNDFSIINNTEKTKSIDLARQQAIKKGLPYFLKESKVIKAVYEEGLELTVTENVIEMLQDGHFESQYAITTNKPHPDMPKFIEFLKGKDRFSEYLFRAKITKVLTQKNKDGNPTTFAIFNINNYDNMNKFDKKLISDTLIEDTKKTKHIKLKSSGEFSKGDTFVYETVASIPKERIKGHKMPTLTFQKPAGVRHLIIQGQHFLNNNNEGINGGALYIGNQKLHVLCKHTKNIFYSKYEWVVYYQEISQYNNQKIELQLI